MDRIRVVMPEVSIIIVNSNTKEWLRQCLVSLRSNEDVDQEVIVVDNASEDGSREMLRQEFPQLKLIFNEEGFGFAYNNNLGAGISTAPVLLFLNPDTKVPAGSLRNMLDVMNHESEAGIFGGKVLDGTGRIERSTGTFPTIISIFLDRLLGYLPLLRPAFERFSQRHYSGYDTLRSVDWVTGAFLWVRRELFTAIGGWDSDIPMYYEDTDLCYRAQKAGYKILYVPQPIVFHFHSRTPIDKKYRKVLMQKGLHNFVCKHYGPVRRCIYRKVFRLPELSPS